MDNFYVSTKTPINEMCSQSSSAPKKHTQINAETTSWSIHEKSTTVKAHFTLIGLYRQCNFRVVCQWKPPPSSNKLSINKCPICTVVFNVGNIGISWTHFLKEKINEEDDSKEQMTLQ